MEEPYDDETQSFIDEDPRPPREREPEYIYYTNPPVSTPQAVDVFGNLDKTAYILIFVTFILGFFMGKTMQPVIIRQ
jgi:hypothetical protein